MHIAVGPWRSGIEDAWADLGDFVPRLALGLGVLVVGWLCAVVTAKLVGLAMDRVATAERRRGRVLTVAVQVRRAVPRLARLGVILVSLWTAVEVVDPGSAESPAADFVDALRGLLLFLGTAAVVTVCAVVAVGVGGGLVRPMERRWELWISRLEAPASAPPGDADTPGGQAPDATTEVGPADTGDAPVGATPARDEPDGDTPTHHDAPASRTAVRHLTSPPVDEPRTRPQPVTTQPPPAAPDSSSTQVIPTTDTPAGTADDETGAAASDDTRTDVMPAGRSPHDR